MGYNMRSSLKKLAFNGKSSIKMDPPTNYGSPAKAKKLPTYKESFTPEVEAKWKDKGGYGAYV